jgi:hypothetical protein
VAGNDVALLQQSTFTFDGFCVHEQRTGVETPLVEVPGLGTLRNLSQSGSSGMEGAFAFLCGTPDGRSQELVVVKRDAEGAWTVAHRHELAGRSLVLSMESPERLWMVKTVGNIERAVHKPSTLQEIALVKGTLKATKLKVAFPDTVVLAASAGGTFFFHDKTNQRIHVYESGTKTVELPVPGGSMIYRYASAPDRFVVHGLPTMPNDAVGYIAGFRRENGAFVRWFEHQTSRIDYIAISGDTVWHSGTKNRSGVYRASFA